MRYKQAVIVTAVILYAASARAEDPAAPAATVAPAVSTTTAAPPPPPKKWKDSVEGSFVSTNGNSKATTTSGKETFSYDFNLLTQLGLEGGGLGARSQGQVTAEQYYAGQKLQRKYDDQDYVFERYHWDKNRFAGIASRHEAWLGVGRELWKTASNVLDFELAPGYINEQRINAATRSFASSRVFAKYVHTFSPTANFSQNAEYLQNLQNTGDLRINTETAITTTLTSLFSIKTSFVWKHASEPPPNAIKDDTITSIALIASF